MAGEMQAVMAVQALARLGHTHNSLCQIGQIGPGMDGGRAAWMDDAAAPAMRASMAMRSAARAVLGTSCVPGRKTSGSSRPKL